MTATPENPAQKIRLLAEERVRQLEAIRKMSDAGEIYQAA